MKKAALFLAIVLPSIALLYFGLTRNPRDLPSALVNRPAPGFDLTSIDGKRVVLKGDFGKPIVLNFWATWCGTCAAEHALVRQATKAFSKDGVVFYSVLYSDTPENARAFVARYGEAAPILIDPDLRTSIDYGVAGVPETFFIDRTGKIVYKQSGMLTPAIVQEKIEALLAQTTEALP